MEPNDRLIERTDRADEQNQEILIEMVAVLGKKWQPVILYQLARDEELGFNDLRSRIPEITNKMLSDGLNTLEDEGLVDRRIVDSKPIRVRYSLTERGEAMEAVIDALLRWGHEHLDTESPATGLTASDRSCEASVTSAGKKRK